MKPSLLFDMLAANDSELQRLALSRASHAGNATFAWVKAGSQVSAYLTFEAARDAPVDGARLSMSIGPHRAYIPDDLARPPYPEHDKLAAVKTQSQAIGEFLDFGGYVLCTVRDAGNNGEPEFLWNDGYESDEPATMADYLAGHASENPEWDAWSEGYVAAPGSIEQKLAAWFEIDLDKIDDEKRAMLAGLRART